MTAKRDVDLAKYRVSAYTLAAAWPVDGVEPVDVAFTALLVLKPDAVAIRPPKLAISRSLRWIEVERDDAAMVARLRHAASLLVGAVAPKHNHKCPWCLFYGAVPTFAGSG